MGSQTDSMTNYQPEARQKFVERAELRRAEHIEGPRSFRQFSDERSGVYSRVDSRDEKLLQQFGIEKNSPLGTMSRYQAAASEEPMENILRRSPVKLSVTALELLERRGIPEEEIPEMIANALGSAKSPRNFWERLEKSWMTSREKRLQVPKGGPGFAKRVAAMDGRPPSKLEPKS